MRIHAIEVGRVRVHKEHFEGSKNRLWVFYSQSWATTIPIHAFLIEHSNGLVLFDTGENPRCHDPSYVPWWTPNTVEYDVKPEDAIDRRIVELGFKIEDIKYVILSHLHTDHIGGVHLFPHATFFVTRREWRDAHRFGASFFGGYHKEHFDYPNFKYNLIDFTPIKGAGVFETGFDLFEDQSMILVPTPGHTRGHQSLLVYKDRPICLAGDAVLSQHHLNGSIVDGIASHPALSLQTIKKLKTWSGMHHFAPVVAVHDPMANVLLSKGNDDR
ncbi:N-acyl homoserine lactonase family protein [Cohnella massiliensis]|uniref:N-acyl homoserine lactonase family protein n=1 Tax=Cohnella massiliensis TaxID=1816691 RepID=UPI0015937846|nr:N-acyl homoserine lactonase family protein [Cohnella massiliensis]